MLLNAYVLTKHKEEEINDVMWDCPETMTNDDLDREAIGLVELGLMIPAVEEGESKELHELITPKGIEVVEKMLLVS